MNMNEKTKQAYAALGITPINWDVIHSIDYGGTCTCCGHDCTDQESKAERRRALDLLHKLAIHGNPYESSPENTVFYSVYYGLKSKENFYFTK